MENNPFAALFSSADQAEQFSLNSKFEYIDTPQSKGVIDEMETASGSNAEDENINSIIENIFLITLNKEPGGQGRPTHLVYLDEVSTSLKQTKLNLENLNQAVFERLMLESPSSCVITTSSKRKGFQQCGIDAEEPKHTWYLYYSYCRFQEQARFHKGAVIEQCRSVILSNCRMCLQHPEFFNGLDFSDQFITLFKDEDRAMFPFFEKVSDEIHANSDEGSVLDAFTPLLNALKTKLKNEVSIGNPFTFTAASILVFFTRKQALAEALLVHCTPPQGSPGSEFEQTVIGFILGASCMKKNDEPPFEFFTSPSNSTKADIDMMSRRINTSTKSLIDVMYQVIYGILKLGNQPRNLMLSWIGNCMHANVGRAKIWSSHVPRLQTAMHASDGFFMNLLSIMLRLCTPFTDPTSVKLLKVQPSYCLATNGDSEHLLERNVHAKGLFEQTFLIPTSTDDPTADTVTVEPLYNFITECFFLTHQCMHLGMHVLLEKFMNMNKDLHQVQRLYREITQQGGQNSEATQHIKDRMDLGMTLYLSMKAVLSEPNMLDNCFDFIVATCSYLTHVATVADFTAFSEVTFPLPKTVSPSLTCLPEFVMENAIDLILFIRRFKDEMYKTHGVRLAHLMTMILVYMGSPNRVKNPHLRARLGEAMDALMPTGEGDVGSLSSNFSREQLFTSHPLVPYMSETLLSVFVSIEMTGESVEFEAKFNYRRPMYAILKYMWTIADHRKALQALAEYAELHIEDTNPPLFLSFINLLINDTIYLIDEALGFMSQIKEKQAEKDSDSWKTLTPQQRQEIDNQLRVLGMQARFHNMMGRSTICSLELLTQRITSIFTHEVMVERIAAMLNHSLQNLVGPKSKSLKVKDFDQYEFEPQELLSTICQVYRNLAGNEKFCVAVAADGRSYSKQLFEEVERVLWRISNPPDVIAAFVALSKKVELLAVQQSVMDQAIENAPEEFLDPIMGTLMRDPVTLPSSGITVDRATIARHVLSDQTDPFNRSTLTMEMVSPHEELKARIGAWVAEIQTKSVPSTSST